MPQFLVDTADLDPLARVARLREGEAHHLVRVHRARPGDPITLFDGRGHRWKALFSGTDGADALLVDLEALPPNESPVSIDLLPAIPKGERWDWLLEKAAELGVTRFRPIRTEYSVFQVGEDRLPGKIVRWQKQLLSACKQCERGRVPALEPPEDLSQLLRRLAAPGDGERRFYLAARSLRPCSFPRVPAPDLVLLAVGPEGGWTPQECGALEQASFHPLSLGPRILRAETACVTAVAFIQSYWGDLEGAGAAW